MQTYYKLFIYILEKHINILELNNENWTRFTKLESSPISVSIKYIRKIYYWPLMKSRHILICGKKGV